PRRIVIVGSEELTELLARISARLGRRVEVVRVISSLGTRSDESLAASLAPEALLSEGVRGILIANGGYEILPIDLLFRCRLSGIRVFDESGFWEQQLGCIDVECVDHDWLVSGVGFRH